jgi:hypothetical protein
MRGRGRPITVVQGSWYFAVGSEFSQDALQELKAGSYAFAPKGSTMFGYSLDGVAARLLQGYASGEIAQYESRDAAGLRFMADEGAVRRAAP